ncbi:hypothetical protein HDU67_009313 [Dinochytrium kinnereticum]|nr:hypothetical protein HDU67_009313 [Dinochytrium kinnereticum]
MLRFYVYLFKLTEESEQSLPFLLDIAQNIVLPLAFNAEDDSIVDEAFKTLSSFPTSHMLQLLPLPKDIIDKLIGIELKDISERNGRCTFLQKLINMEIDGMRKPVFKGLSTQSSREDGGRGYNQLDDVFKKYKKSILSLWEGPAKAAHMKSALAVSHQDSSVGNYGKSTPFHKKLPFYKIFITGLTDMTFRDNFAHRLEAQSFWTPFWEGEIGGFFKAENVDREVSIERATALSNDFISIAVEELFEKRLKVERMGHVLWNILMSLSALLNVSMNYGSTVPLDVSDKVLTFLMNEFYNSQACESDEAKAATFFALAYICRSLMPTDDIALTKVAEFLLGSSGKLVSGDSDFAVSASYSVGLLMAHVYSMSPTSPLVDKLLEFLMEAFSDTSNQSSRRLGASLGISLCPSILRRNNVADVLASTSSHNFKTASISVGGVASNQSCLAFSADLWMLSFLLENVKNISTITKNDILSTLGRLNKENFPQFPRSLLEMCEKKLEKSSLSIFSVPKYLNQISETNKASEKVAKLTALPCLFDVTGPSAMSAQDALSDCLKSLDFLKSVLSAGEPKESRTAGWAIGKLLRCAQMMIGPGSQLNAHTEKNEPLNYDRLSEETSFLRVCFDYLSEPLKIPPRALEFLLTSIATTGRELPSVNWMPVFSKVLESSVLDSVNVDAFASDIIQFICLQSKRSRSAQAVLLELFKVERFARNEVLVGKGTGRVLELGGASKQDEGGRRLPDIAISKVMEIMNLVVYKGIDGPEDLHLRVLFFSTLSAHLEVLEAEGPAQKIRHRLASFAGLYFMSVSNSVPASEYPLLTSVISIILTHSELFSGIWADALKEFKQKRAWKRPYIALVLRLAELTLDKAGRGLPRSVSDAFISQFGSPDNAISRVIGQHLAAGNESSQFAADLVLGVLSDSSAKIFLKDEGSWIVRVLDVCILLEEACDLSSWIRLLVGLRGPVGDSVDDLQLRSLEFAAEFPTLIMSTTEEARSKIFKRLLTVDSIIRKSTDTPTTTLICNLTKDLLLSFPADEERRHLNLSLYL